MKVLNYCTFRQQSTPNHQICMDRRIESWWHSVSTAAQQLSTQLAGWAAQHPLLAGAAVCCAVSCLPPLCVFVGYMCLCALVVFGSAFVFFCLLLLAGLSVAVPVLFASIVLGLVAFVSLLVTLRAFRWANKVLAKIDEGRDGQKLGVGGGGGG